MGRGPFLSTSGGGCAGFGGAARGEDEVAGVDAQALETLREEAYRLDCLDRMNIWLDLMNTV